MAAIFQAAGTAVNTTTTTLALVAPTMVANDLMFALIIHMNNTAASGFDTRWTTLYDANNVGSRIALYSMPVIAGDSAATFNFTVAGTTTSLGRLYTWRGAKGIGKTTSSVNASSATITWATLGPSNASSSIAAFFGIGTQLGSDGGIASAANYVWTARGGTPYNTGTTSASEAYSSDGSSPQLTGALTMNNTSAAINTGLLVEILSTENQSGGGSSTGSGLSALSGRSGSFQDLARSGARGLGSGLLG